MKTAVISAEQEKIEAQHVAFVRGWSGRIGEWTLRAAALRKEQQALEEALAKESAAVTMQLVRLGYSVEDAQLRVEHLLEDAFRKAPQ